MTSTLENMKRTTQAVLEAIRSFQVEEALALRTDDCMHQMLPKSVGRPPMSNQEFREWAKAVTPMFRTLPMLITTDNEIYDVASRKAALHMFSAADTPAGEYSNEYAIFLTFNEDGTKISYVGEMVDSAYTVKFLAGVEEYGKNHGGEMAGVAEAAR
ncbi:hypothetical protein LTR36_003045 [Oleoguttula mirabilis]|uniref:SnoaL-like domain-containing protein n=1 Tax=Oleoguttula mirabilis TaxID=1507867 RepID=A0AAV9JWT4_9PEZI|nr:hypothetical protein LTR36_003045 [Oleoguttula mirabilis]